MTTATDASLPRSALSSTPTPTHSRSTTPTNRSPDPTYSKISPATLTFERVVTNFPHPKPIHNQLINKPVKDMTYDLSNVDENTRKYIEDLNIRPIF